MLGRTIANRYKITEEISQDSLTSLYKALDQSENKPVFITILKEKAKARPLETLLRFKREQEQLLKLSHSNLLKVHSQGEFEGADYVVNEYFDSMVLSKFLSQPQNIGQPLNIDVAVELILQVSSALDLAHQNNIFHQALNLQSILLTADLKTSKLTNFGYNLLTDISRISEPNEIISTFGYLSPESSGILRKPIDSRSDNYSLGILFYQLITGRLPYLAQDISTIIYQHIATKPESPSKFNPKIPPVLDNIILRLIAKDPQDRYQSLSGLIFDLMEYQVQRAQGKELVDFEIARFDKLRQLNFSTRLIGRDNELDQLITLLNQTKSSKGSLCFVFGEPGIGKSRLIDELRVHVHSLSGLFCGGKCYQYEFRTPYKVFSEAVDAYIEKVKRLPQIEQQTHIKRIKDTLGELGGEVVKIAPTFTDLIGQPPKLVELEPEKEKIRFLITVTNFLASLSTPETPLLMFLDDLQWVDDGSLEILERLAEKLQNTPTLLIVSYRDTEVDQSHPLAQLISRITSHESRITNIPVKSFSLPETAQMICQILIEKEEQILPLANELQERTKGNPFFILELLHSLVDSGVVFLKKEHYTYDLEKLKTVSLPTTIVDAVLKRMKDLGEEDLEIISYASIMGKEIEFKLLTELARKPADKIVASLEDGIRNQLLFRDLTGQENIFFMHDRIREAFYQRISEEERIPLHKHVAEVLEEQNKTNPDSVLYDLAYHFTQSKVEDKALQYSMPAAHKAKSSYANTLAISLYNTAKEILERQDKKESKEYIEVLENLGDVYRLTGRFEESIDTLKACESLIVKQDKFRKAQILSKMAETLTQEGKLEDSSQVLKQELLLLEVKFPQATIGVVLGILKEFTIQMLHTWFPKIFVNETSKTDTIALTIVKLYIRLCYNYFFVDIIRFFYCYIKLMNLTEKKLGPCVELANIYSNGGAVWGSIPWISRALRDARLGIKVAQYIGDKTREGCAYTMISAPLYFNNTPKESLEYAQKGINLLKSIGEYWELGVGYAFRSYSDLVLGRLREGIEDTNEFIGLCETLKVWQPLGWAYFIKGKFHCSIGDVDEQVIEQIEEAEKIRERIREKNFIMYIPAILAFAYFRTKEYDKAVENMDKAIKLFYAYFIQKAAWTMDLFAMGAEVYLDKITRTPNISPGERKIYLKKAYHCCWQAMFWGRWCKTFLGWSCQVNGTYLWLTGKKRKAVKTWEKGLKFLRENKNNPGGDKYRIAYILLEEAKFLLKDNPKDKKAYSNLIEARDLFTEMGCKLDLETCNKLLESISPEGVVLDSRQVLTQKRHLDSLLSVTQAIGSIFVLDELLQKILEYGLKVTGAERGFLLLYDEKDKQLKLKVSHGLEKELVNLSFSYENYKLSLELINEVNNTKTASIADQTTAPNPKIPNELKAFSVKQAIAVPLRTREKPLGILYMDNRLAGGMFGRDELELMKSFAVQASVSIENAYLVANLVEQERLKQELELGRQIQTALLPKESPTIPNLKLSGLMLPAKEIGGDYYDFVDLPNNNLAVVIGDVSGKGVAAGLLMAMAKTAIHTLSQEETSPRNVLLRTNQILVKHIGSQKFMTMLYFRYDTQSKTLTYSSAGHEHILVYRGRSPKYHPSSQGEGAAPEETSPKVESILSGGFMLGMIPDIANFLQDNQINLKGGDKIILYTDGVTEARNPNEDLFGLERLIQTIQKHGSKPADELLSSIKEEVYSFIGTREQYDDITLVVMEAV